ncbi:MAG: FkbM family methyltransferase [Gammaproteobacteria bacterium]
MKRSGKLMRILVRPRLARTLLRHGVAASVEHIAALRDLQCRAVVDIGANRGQFSLLARELFPEARIVAFEPLPGPAAMFQCVFAHDARTSLHNIAIGPESTRTTIHVSARDDSSSLLPIAETQSRIFPGTQETGTADVEVRRLSVPL